MEFEDWQRIASSINCTRILPEWRTLEFKLQTVDKRSSKRPNICTIYMPGVIAFRADLRSAIFPFGEDDLEFLPINVSGEKWLIMSCLKTVYEIDEDKSQVHRDISGDIFLIMKLCVTDSIAYNCELFTLAESNRSVLFVRSSLKDRIESLKLEGIQFRLIGEVV